MCLCDCSLLWLLQGWRLRRQQEPGWVPGLGAGRRVHAGLAKRGRSDVQVQAQLHTHPSSVQCLPLCACMPSMMSATSETRAPRAAASVEGTRQALAAAPAGPRRRRAPLRSPAQAPAAAAPALWTRCHRACCPGGCLRLRLLTCWARARRQAPWPSLPARTHTLPHPLARHLPLQLSRPAGQLAPAEEGFV